MIISYCTVCGGRLWQLRRTLEHNLSFTEAGRFELCVLAYNDSTIEPYLREYYADYLLDGRLKVKTHFDNYQPADGSDFACGYVKNLSHAMGTGEILFNLDADNFIGEAHELLQHLKPSQVIKSRDFKQDGRSGRIGVYRELFTAVGGYRDTGRTDDGDFILRCLRAGAKLVHMNCSIPPLPNVQP
ncbi:hypothetical protein [Acinetobacter sp. ANC 3813]|uniref:hypothetical protein n=1 Tax=Acinetobacter sp. ANC 3813 TaxID=1977873 RepID=UPI000A335DDD|nr:hypothetical protein [Acinetobacter sp. ANC 3813]OTG87888.1 hypothetical protein B9T34_16265 [Acinetobacter sp. ANC 3813]